MKNYYKISEISKLYGIGVDSLRYYERLGVLRPRRDVNGYRLYSLKDIYKLNIISDLRELDFSMKQIKEYLDHQDIDHTLELLQGELRVLRRQLNDLNLRKRIIRDRIAALQQLPATPVDVFTIQSLPERPCVRINEYITRDEEMDFAIKKLHRKHEDKIRTLGNLSIGAAMSEQDMQNGLLNVFRSVFFLLDESADAYDFILPAGSYLCYHYRGDYRQSAQRIQEVLEHARRNGRKPLGDPFEIYKIDNRDTIEPREFLTEIQVLLHDDASQ